MYLYCCSAVRVCVLILLFKELGSSRFKEFILSLPALPKSSFPQSSQPQYCVVVSVDASLLFIFGSLSLAITLINQSYMIEYCSASHDLSSQLRNAFFCECIHIYRLKKLNLVRGFPDPLLLPHHSIPAIAIAIVIAIACTGLTPSCTIPETHTSFLPLL